MSLSEKKSWEVNSYVWLEPDITAHAEDRLVVSGDRDGLRQVIPNLMRNALGHTPARTPIEMSARRDGEEAVVEVRDHGPGLPAREGDELFERFWRAESGRERGRAGAGLGLAIVAAIVARHGGAVRAENAPGGGAAFSFRLPIEAPPGDLEPADLHLGQAV